MWIWGLVALGLLLASGGTARGRGPARPGPLQSEARRLAARWAPAFGVPVAHVLATIDHESGFRNEPNLTGRDLSRGGAWGLMQMTFATAKDEAARALRDAPAAAKTVIRRWDQREPQRLSDPELNVVLGTSHLARLEREFGHDFAVASAAYNHGSPAVKKLLDRDGDLRNLNPQVKQYVATAEERLRRYA